MQSLVDKFQAKDDRLFFKDNVQYIKEVMYMKFNEKLIELRKKHGISQEELGNKINVSRIFYK